jgi:hypothetical protein
MKTAVRLCVGLALLSCGIVALAADAEETPPPPAADGQPNPEEEIRQTLNDYVGAYNRSDAAAVAATWIEQGVYVDEASGE